MNKEIANFTQLLIQTLCKKVDNLEKRLDEKHATINRLKTELSEIKRVNYQERYKSKDCLIFTSFPVPPTHLTVAMCRAICYFFSYKITPESIKACHPLPTKNLHNQPVIMKFYTPRIKTKFTIDEESLQTKIIRMVIRCL